MSTVSLLGSTGSIGTQALEVIAAVEPGRFEVVGLGASGRDLAAFEAQIDVVRPPAVAVADTDAAKDLRSRRNDVEVLAGPEGLAERPVPRLSTAITRNLSASGPVSLPISDTSRPRPPSTTSGAPEPCDS